MESVFYLGACSPQGFASHYDSLLHKGLQLNVIKGGSGCGKSRPRRCPGVPFMV